MPHLLCSNSNRAIKPSYLCLTVIGASIFQAGPNSLRCYAKVDEVVKSIVHLVHLVDRIIVRWAMWVLFARNLSFFLRGKILPLDYSRGSFFEEGFPLTNKKTYVPVLNWKLLACNSAVAMRSLYVSFS